LDQERDVVNVVKNHLNRFDIIHSHTLTHQIYALPDVDKLPLCATLHNLPHNLPSMIDTPCFIGGTEYISDYIKMYVGTYAETINDTMNKRWFKQTDKKLDHFLYDGLVESNSVLDAIKLSKHHLLYIIGSCSSYSLQLENVISYYRILGEVSYQIERLLYQSAEYLINPSDPTGLKSIQAMLSGTPIISKRTEFNKEFVNVKNGYLYSDEDDALAFMSKENKWDFRLNDKFNFDVQMERYLDAYERIIGEDKW
jgi:hypothetical protein